MDVGDNINKGRASWNFSGDVAKTFVDHVRRSVPMYDGGHDLICYLSDFFCNEDSVCYELGVSTGQLTKKLADYNSHKSKIRWIGIDREEMMIEKGKEHCKDVKNIELICDDITTFPYEKADMIVSYYCIQFLPESVRQMLFNKIYEILNWGGAFILFEKVRGPDARFQDIMTSIYHDNKLRNGYTPEEIMGKAQSLRGVLDPFSTEGNLGLMKRAGFVDIMSVFKYVYFEGFLAIK